MSALPEPSVDTVIFDLDGLVRNWGDNELEAAERAAGIPTGTILAKAFEPELGIASITGALTYEAWQDRIAADLVPIHGERIAPILSEWRNHRGTIDFDMLDLERQVRRQVRTALLTNGSTRLEEDLEVLGLTNEWDHVFNTSRIGVAKPEPAIFVTVLEQLELAPGRAAFVDDHPANVESALSLGLIAHQHTDISTTAEFLASIGLPTTYSAAPPSVAPAAVPTAVPTATFASTSLFADTASDAMDQRNPVP